LSLSSENAACPTQDGPSAVADEVLARLRRIDDTLTCVMLIGHNPGVADLTALLVARR
jgi:phosphohistidine phosphatase SixA